MVDDDTYIVIWWIIMVSLVVSNGRELCLSYMNGDSGD